MLAGPRPPAASLRMPTRHRPADEKIVSRPSTLRVENGMRLPPPDRTINAFIFCRKSLDLVRLGKGQGGEPSPKKVSRGFELNSCAFQPMHITGLLEGMP